MYTHYLRFEKDLEAPYPLRYCRNKCSIYFKLMVSQFLSMNTEAGERDYC